MTHATSFDRMPVSKTDQVRKLMVLGNVREAMRIAKSFKRGLTVSQSNAIRTAYECLVYPEFYEQVGIDLQATVSKGLNATLELAGLDNTK